MGQLVEIGDDKLAAAGVFDKAVFFEVADLSGGGFSGKAGEAG